MFDGDLTLAKARFFKALGDETRIKILEALRKNRWMSVTDICDETGKEQSSISHHLACLRNCGLVKTKKKGKFILYSLNGDLVQEILKLSDNHVRTLFEKILACEILS
ncbi:MAG: ArsR/SmtB family transcription factor [Candidatus Hydrothermarchaeota archaeon]